MKSWSDIPRPITSDWPTLWKEFVSTWSINVAVLSVVLGGDVIICSKELEKQNSKYFFFARGCVSL